MKENTGKPPIVGESTDLELNQPIHLESFSIGTLAGSLDDILDGNQTTGYSKLYSTDIASGHIKLTTAVSAAGKWYDYTGVVLDASYGVSLYGGHVALRTFATSGAYATWLALADIDDLTGVQCYVGTDGAIYAGAGAIKMDASALKITDLGIWVYSGATLKGKLGYGFNALALGSESGVPIVISAGGQISLTAGSPALVEVGGILKPDSDSVFTLGASDKRWSAIYGLEVGAYTGVYTNLIKPISSTIVYFGVGTTTTQNFLPTISDYHCIGSPDNYWWKLYADHIYYKDHAAFQKHDDLAIIKAMTVKEVTDKDGKKVEMIDFDSIHPDLKEGELVSLGAMQGLTLGAIKQLVKRLELLEEKVK